MSTSGVGLLDSATGQVLTAQLPASLSSCLQILSTISAIDFTAAGTTTLYTPSGKTAIITGVMIRPTTVTTFVSAASVSIGQNASVNDIIPITALTALNATGLYFPLLASLLAAVAPSATPIKLKVTTPAVATALIGAVDLIGYLI